MRTQTTWIREEKLSSSCRAIAALLSVTLFAGAVAWVQAQTPSPQGTPGHSASLAVRITGQQNGQQINMPRATTLVVQLPSNPSTGYDWFIKGDPSPLRLLKSVPQVDNSANQIGGFLDTGVAICCDRGGNGISQS